MVDQVKVIEIGADAIEQVFQDQPLMAMTHPPKLMHAVVAALGRHGYIIEDRYEEDQTPWAPVAPPETPIPTPVDMRPDWVIKGQTAPDWEISGDDA